MVKPLWYKGFYAVNACGGCDTIAAGNEYAKAIVAVGLASVEYLAVT